MIRLRSGYAGIGYFTHTDGAALPCPKCGGFDTIRHMLLDCEAHIVERTLLFEKVAGATNGSEGATLGLLLGFNTKLATATLQTIMTATAQYVLDIGRHI